LDVTPDGKYLYQLEGLNGAISAYSINSDNSLSFVQEITGYLPEVDTQGIIAFDRFLVGDCNSDGFVSLLDIQSFVDSITSGTFSREADINGDGVVDLLDVQGFIDLLLGS